MAETFSQARRHISISTPLGTDKLLLKSISGREAVSETFEYSLELQSEDPNINFEDIVGHPVTVNIKLPGGGDRYLSGYINRFRFVHQGGYLTSYQATLVPQLWLLSQTADCRVFQNKKVPDILEEVLQEHGVTDYDVQLSGSYREWEYCVQYRETDLNFLNRLMEQEGIYFYFTHSSSGHTLVMCDTGSNLDPYPQYETIANRSTGVSGKKEIREDYFQPQIWAWTVEQQVRSGKVSVNDYNFTSPKANQMSENKIARSHGEAEFEIYDYPGEFKVAGDGKTAAKIRMEAIAAGHELASGQTDARGIAAGHLFEMTDHPRKDQNREYLILSTTLSASGGAFDQQSDEGSQFEARFTAMPSENPYRAPARATKTLVEGPQTAVVTGPGGEEIHCDEYGRVKVQFHWDRLGGNDENSSCWVRVSQIHAGKGWGSMHVPRIGEEVVVSFLEGDPDQPMITGRVYNADNMPAYKLPAEKTRSGYQSRSTKGGGAANFNELTFEDKKGSEQVYMHAEKNMDTHIENDETRFVGNNREKEVVKDEDTKIGENRTEDVGMDETITIGMNRTEKVGMDETIKIGMNRETTIGINEELMVTASRKKTVMGGETNTVMTKRDTSVIGNDTLTIAAQLSLTAAAGINVTTPAAMNVTAAGGINLTAPAGINILDGTINETSGTKNTFTPSEFANVGVKFEIIQLATAITNIKNEFTNLSIAHNVMAMSQTVTAIDNVATQITNGALDVEGSALTIFT